MKDCDSGGRGAGDLPRARAVFVLPEKLASSLQALSGAAALSSQQGGCSVCDQRVPPPTNTCHASQSGRPPPGTPRKLGSEGRRGHGAVVPLTLLPGTGRQSYPPRLTPKPKLKLHKPNWSSWLEGHLRTEHLPGGQQGEPSPARPDAWATDHPPPPARTWGGACLRTVTQALRQATHRFQTHSFQMFPRQLTEGLPRAGSLMGWEDSSQEPAEKGRKGSHGENNAKPGRLDAHGTFWTSAGNPSHLLSN